MTLFNAVQSMVLFVVLMICLWKAANQLLPGQVRLAMGWLAMRVNGQPAWRRRLSRRLAPAPQVAAGCRQIGSSSGCASCRLAQVTRAGHSAAPRH